jgi:hypothetical protein
MRDFAPRPLRKPGNVDIGDARGSIQPSWVQTFDGGLLIAVTQRS